MKKIDNSVQFSVTMKSEDYERVKEVLPTRVFNELETRREIAIMTEVFKHEGNTVQEKVDNTLNEWSQRTNEEKVIRYKIRHR